MPRLLRSAPPSSINAAAQALWPYKYVILAAFLGGRYLLEAKKQPEKNTRIFYFFFFVQSISYFSSGSGEEKCPYGVQNIKGSGRLKRHRRELYLHISLFSRGGN